MKGQNNVMAYRVLVADDDHDIRQAITIYLKNEGLEVSEAANGEEVLRIIANEEVHLLILDVMMPILDGLTTAIKLRENDENIPILMLSAKSEDIDKIHGLQVGADDYLEKPFNPLELMARVRAHLRRYTKLGTMEKPASVLTIEGLTLDQVTKIVTIEGQPLKMTPKEFQILALLMSHPNQVFSMEQIYEQIWKEVGFNIENTVSVHIRKIREKIEIDPKKPKYLKVVWGVGYKIEH